jgi:hypothetical protein
MAAAFYFDDRRRPPRLEAAIAELRRGSPPRLPRSPGGLRDPLGTSMVTTIGGVPNPRPGGRPRPMLARWRRDDPGWVADTPSRALAVAGARPLALAGISCWHLDDEQLLFRNCAEGRAEPNNSPQGRPRAGPGPFRPQSGRSGGRFRRLRESDRDVPFSLTDASDRDLTRTGSRRKRSPFWGAPRGRFRGWPRAKPAGDYLSLPSATGGPCTGARGTRLIQPLGTTFDIGIVVLVDASATRSVAGLRSQFRNRAGGDDGLARVRPAVRLVSAPRTAHWAFLADRFLIAPPPPDGTGSSRCAAPRWWACPVVVPVRFARHCPSLPASLVGNSRARRRSGGRMATGLVVAPHDGGALAMPSPHSLRRGAAA